MSDKSTPAPKPLDSAATIRKQFRLSLFKSLVVPSLLLLFFIAAPYWLSARLHTEIRTAIQRDTSLSEIDKADRIYNTERVDFQRLALHGIPGLEAYRERLGQTGIIGRFQKLHVALITAWTLMLLLAFGFASMLAFAGTARHSQADLISAFRWGWRITMVLALANVVLLVPLLLFGVFEFSVLLTGAFLPYMLLLFGLGGLFAFYATVKILCTPIPMEFREPMARRISPEDAPALWETVRDAASRLGTAPPDNILIGMQHNFYVTEIDVVTNTGRVSGNTLFLSYPLLKQLSAGEVMAVIGHELGHFIGADTSMTLHFFPLRHKVRRILAALGKCGLAAFPSFNTVSFFVWTFEGVAKQSSRARELLADKAGAQLAGIDIQARALIRLHVIFSAFQKGLLKYETSPGANPFDSATARFAPTSIAPEDPFWTAVFKEEQAHPMDTHPRLSDRLESLGLKFGPQEARGIACADAPPAFDSWFPGGSEPLFAGIISEAQSILSTSDRLKRLADADIATPEGRQLLEDAFPERTWASRPLSFWLGIAMLTPVYIGLIAGLFFAPGPQGKSFFAMFLIFLCYPVFCYWIRNHRATLTLNASGVRHSGWKYPIPFSDIELIRARATYGNILLLFRLKQKAVSPLKFAPPIRYRVVSLNLSKFKGKPKDTANLILRYSVRQPEAPTLT